MTTNIEFKNNNLIVVRTYKASIEKVFEAWIETSKVKQWWGCAECIDVRSEIEPRVGGAYNHHMTIENEHGRFDVKGFATLVEYDPPNRIAYTSNDENDPMIITVDFKSVEGGTEVRMVHSNIPDMKVEGDIPMKDIIQAGWTAAYQKLSNFLESELQSADN